VDDGVFELGCILESEVRKIKARKFYGGEGDRIDEEFRAGVGHVDG
jgi:hypothetical protein